MIVIVANDYELSIDIADAVRQAIELKQYNDEDVYIPLITFAEIREDVQEDSYLQQMLVEFEIQSK